MKESAPQREFFSSIQHDFKGFDVDIFMAIFTAASASVKGTLQSLEGCLDCVVQERISDHEYPNSYTQEAIDATDFKQNLFDIMLSGSELGSLAAIYLNRIYLLRCENGKSSSESKHPDREFRKAFPIESQTVWDRLSSQSDSN